MNFRSDLALERHEYISKNHTDGIISTKEKSGSAEITTIEVVNENGERTLGKPAGKYITIELGSLMKNSDLSGEGAEIVAEQIKKLLPKEGSVLVVGLGNESITSDALGPKCVSLLLATRHIGSELARSIGLEGLRSVAVIAPGVLGKTGMETAEIIDGIVRKINPSAVIAIDALAARKLSRLGNTVQLSDTGISPGSGVGNRRSEISQKTLGIPVIAVGVPTVVDGATMVYDTMEKYGIETDEFEKREMFSDERTVMVTPKEIDLVIERASRLVAMGINCALQTQMDAEDILKIVS